MVEIYLDKQRRLSFGITSMRELENALGSTTMGNIIRDLGTLGINTLVVATYYGLKHEDPSLNPRLVERILDTMLKEGRSLTELYDALPKALEATGVFKQQQDVDQGKSQTPTPA